MTKDDIISLPDSRLRQNSNKVLEVDEEIKTLIQAMKAATLDWEVSRDHEVGVALAAVQVGELKRIIVVRDDSSNKSDHKFSVFINPEITKKEGALVKDYEGCLSVPDIYGLVPRYEKIRMKALDIHGREFRLKADGFLARVLQHEIDHTNGRLFIDLIKNKSSAFYHLASGGKLEPLDYKKHIANNVSLWN